VTLQTTVDPAARDVNGDRDRLEQALQNLAANAIRYAPRGSVLRLSSRAAAGAVVLSVEDAGADGIAAEHLPHIFDRFYKADASRAGVKGGSGLGLSIVKAIVERHGGTISVASRPGRTVFEIVLPAAPG
jgi:signal transduction histidine kinase